MITTDHVIKLSIKGGVETRTHVVRVTITGRAALDQLATIVEANGNPRRAAQLRRARRFTMKMSPEAYAKLEK